mgnify:CR=1 FL=1
MIREGLRWIWGAPAGRLLGLLLVYLILEWLEFRQDWLLPGGAPLDASVGLAFVAMLVGGVRVLPVVMLGEIGSVVLRSGEGEMLWLPALAGAVLTAASWGGAAWMSRHRVGSALTDQRSLAALIAVAALAALGSASGSLLPLWFASGGEGDWAQPLIRAWTGDMIGVMVVAPPLLALRAGLPAPDRATLAEAALQILASLAMLALLFHLPAAAEWQVYDLLVLPAIWAAARFGAGGAMMINLVLQVGLMVGFVTVMRDAEGLTAYQARMLILTLSTLFLGVAVTGRRRASDGLRRRQDQLDRCARLSLAGEMAAALAHEINQPLSAALTYARAAGRLLDSGTADPVRLRAALTGAASQTERAGAIVRSLREFIGRGELDRRPQDLPALVREALALVDSDRQRAGIRVELALARGLPPLLVDTVQVQQVLVNLLRNAIEALESGGRAGRRQLALTAWRDPDGRVAVEIADSGPGLDPELAGRLFQPFATTKAAGMGLGLAICRTIIEAHGGRLWLAGNGPRGCAFRFTLPVVEQGGGE